MAPRPALFLLAVSPGAEDVAHYLVLRQHAFVADPVTRLNAALEGRYRIESELGERRMATVYLADHLKHDRKG